MQETKCIDWQELERKVKSAINDCCPFDFDSKEIVDREIEECEYMQKVAEVQLSKLDVLLGVVLFVVASGGSFAVVSISDDRLAFYAIYALILFIIGGITFYFWYRMSNKCCQLILGLEKRIQSENFKKRKAKDMERSTQ